jgi:trans-aconitate 2-methyltransferase
MWDAERYARFAGEYSRPFFDLLARIAREDLGTVVDLGCGPGDLTRVLAERWPDATVLGLDSCADMLARARSGPALPRLTFVQADISTWRPVGPVDLLVSNAALQWVPGHERLLPRLAGMLAPGGVLAIQMPDHFAMPVSRAIAEAVNDMRWRSALEGVGLQPDTVQPLSWYVTALRGLGLAVDAWETTYLRVWAGDNPVLEWMKATALRPMLRRLGPDEAEAFLKAAGERFRAYYPKTGEVTLVPAKRMFFVATRGA